jgi:hypothetical protein
MTSPIAKIVVIAATWQLKIRIDVFFYKEKDVNTIGENQYCPRLFHYVLYIYSPNPPSTNATN